MVGARLLIKVKPFQFFFAPSRKANSEARALQTLSRLPGVLEPREAFGVRACLPPLLSCTERKHKEPSSFPFAVALKNPPPWIPY